MRHCGNCEYSYKTEDIIELGTNEDQLDCFPEIGTCCLSMKPVNGFCSSHVFVDGLEEYDNYVYYDDSFGAPGYMIVSKLDDEIKKFIKIFLFGENGFPQICLRGFEMNCKDDSSKEYNEIDFKISQNERIYTALCKLYQKIESNPLYSIDINHDGKSRLLLKKENENIHLVLAKDIYGAKSISKYTGVNLGDETTCRYYSEIIEFYNNLSTLSQCQISDKEISKILKMK